jgi:hypothetical protein
MPDLVAGDWHDFVVELSVPLVSRFAAVTRQEPWSAAQPVPLMALSIVVNAGAKRFYPSPPGTIHARQRLRVHRPIPAGVTLDSRVRRAPDQVRKGRTYVVLEFEMRAAGDLVAWAESQSLWPERSTDVAAG